MNRTIRLSDVARAAGVSLGTASNAFNKPDALRPELRETVLKAASELGYAGPDPKGRLLMGGRAYAIGILPAGDMSVSHAVGNPYLRSLLLGVAEVCDANDSNLMIISGADDRKEWAIRSALVDGFILGHRDEATFVASRANRVPIVVVDMDGGPGIGSVQIAAREGARLAAQHLLSLGHRKIAILAAIRRNVDPVWHPPGGDRGLASPYPIDLEKMAGYAEAMAAQGLSIDDMPMVSCHPPARSEEGAAMLLDRLEDATAVLVMSDRQALAVLREAQRRGIRVPEDISVIGFDNVPGAETSSPPLTTIVQPIVEKGRAAAQMLFEATPRVIKLPVELLVRASTAPPKTPAGQPR